MNHPFMVRSDNSRPHQQRSHVDGYGQGLGETLGPPTHTRRFARGETICEPGEAAIVGYIVRGTVKLVTFLPDGRTNIVSLIEAPGFFGRVFGITAEFAIEAATDVVLACFEPDAFAAQLSESPTFEHFIHMENLYQLDEAHERIIVLACQSIAERMATFMALRLVTSEVRAGGSTPDNIVHVMVNRRDFAAYLGTTVETVSRTIQALVRRGTIDIIDSATFRILRRNDLFKIARQDEDDLFEMVNSRNLRTKPKEFLRAAAPAYAPHGALRVAAE